MFSHFTRSNNLHIISDFLSKLLINLYQEFTILRINLQYRLTFQVTSIQLIQHLVNKIRRSHDLTLRDLTHLVNRNLDILQRRSVFVIHQYRYIMNLSVNLIQLNAVTMLPDLNQHVIRQTEIICNLIILLTCFNHVIQCPTLIQTHCKIHHVLQQTDNLIPLVLNRLLIFFAQFT